MNFLKEIFGSLEGHLCIVTIKGGKEEEDFFEYPDGAMFAQETALEAGSKQGVNVYFYPALFDNEDINSPIVANPVIAADLNMVSPVLVSPIPDIVVESSKGRYQAYWHRNGNTSAYQPVSVNGPVDVDLKLRRFPGTYNWKYKGESWKVHSVDVSTFDTCDKVRKRLDLFGEQFSSLFIGTDRWSLARTCARLGGSAQDVFLVLQGNQNYHGWQPGTDEFATLESLYKEAINAVASMGIPSLLTDEEVRNRVIEGDSFVTKYVDWATSCTDSPLQYHVAVALSVLSSLLCPHVRLETSFGEFRTNLWFMILAGTTSTRKTTAMRLGMGLLKEVDSDPILSTSGGAEGIISALSDRDSQSSIFYRDEITGLIDEMTRKDYMSGFMESLTKLYDGEEEKRTLSKKTIHVKDPNLIILAGGIKDRMSEMLSMKHVGSGFIPRFIVVSGWTDIADMKPIGPPVDSTVDLRSGLATYLANLKAHYSKRRTAKAEILGKVAKARIVKVAATDEAWDRMRKLEADVRELGLTSDNPNVFGPIYERLMNSIIKVSILLASDRAFREQSELPVLDLRDLQQAIGYSSVWMESVYEIARNIDDKPSDEERRLQKIEDFIVKSDGVTRSSIMQRFRLTARSMTELEATLIQRGTVTSSKVNKSTVYRKAAGEL